MFQYADLIGKPFELGGRGPAVYDCYGLVMEMYRRRYGVELPDFDTPNNMGEVAYIMSENAWRWQETELKPGVLVHMKVAGVHCHVGFTLSVSKFIHVYKESGGVCTERTNGDWRHRILGYYEFVGK
jgi:cell wall-associated NlpC family hydrolase